MSQKSYGLLFRAACQSFKYFFLFLAGFAIACILSGVVLGVEIPYWTIVLVYLGRMAVAIGCLLVLAVVYESIRH